MGSVTDISFTILVIYRFICMAFSPLHSFKVWSTRTSSVTFGSDCLFPTFWSVICVITHYSETFSKAFIAQQNIIMDVRSCTLERQSTVTSVNLTDDLWTSIHSLSVISFPPMNFTILATKWQRSPLSAAPASFPPPANGNTQTAWQNTKRSSKNVTCSL